MQSNQVRGFLRSLEELDKNRWDREALQEFAKLKVPHHMLGPKQLLLEVDVTVLHAWWFIESVADLAIYVHDENKHILHLGIDVVREIRRRYSALPLDEVKQLAETITEIAWGEVLQRRARKRHNIALADRRLLWSNAQPDPRCYLCGYQFSPQAGARLVRSGTAPIPEPPFVDFTRPRGLNLRDLRIEVDHVRPVTAGGLTDISNLRLACGWCNRVKSKYGSLYDVGSWAFGKILNPHLGWVTVPQPFWVLRLVSMIGRCEEASGCTATLNTHELFAGPQNARGALNPANFAVYCSDHDPWSYERYISLSTARSRI